MSETLNAILQVRMNGSRGDGLRCEKKVDPAFEGKWGGEPLTQPQLQLVMVVVFPSRARPFRASLRCQGEKQARAVPVPTQVSQDTNN